MRLLLLCALALLGCESVLSAQTFKLVQLPADVQTGPASIGVQTKEGRIFAGPVTGGLLRLQADAGAWEELPPPSLARFLPDFKDGLALAQGNGGSGLLRAVGDDFTAFFPTVPALRDPAFTTGLSAVLGRDATGTFWASVAPTFGGINGKVVVAHFDPASADWIYDEVPTELTLGSARPAMTSDARFFFRPQESGLWEIDVPNHVLVERVPCTHELFRPSGEGFMQCQEQTYVFAGLNGELFLLNAHRELWRVPARGTAPSLVVKGELPRLATEGRAQAAPLTYVDPKGRVWLGFRWGTNVDGDVSYLYVAEPSKSDKWTFLKKDLPRSIVLLGNANTPLISSVSQNTGLLLFRAAE